MYLFLYMLRTYVYTVLSEHICFYANRFLGWSPHFNKRNILLWLRSKACFCYISSLLIDSLQDGHEYHYETGQESNLLGKLSVGMSVTYQSSYSTGMRTSPNNSFALLHCDAYTILVPLKIEDFPPKVYSYLCLDS